MSQENYNNGREAERTAGIYTEKAMLAKIHKLADSKYGEVLAIALGGDINNDMILQAMEDISSDKRKEISSLIGDLLYHVGKEAEPTATYNQLKGTATKVEIPKEIQQIAHILSSPQENAANDPAYIKVA